jgi:hypothetical protein
MMGLKYYTLYAVLLGINQTLASHTLVHRAIQKVQDDAIRHTHSLANDLRVAFSSVLLPRADTDQLNHVVYCKSGKQAVFGNGNTGSSGNSSSSGTASHTGSSSSTSTISAGSSRPATSTNVGSSPTSVSTTPSLWKLTESHVSDLLSNNSTFIQ